MRVVSSCGSGLPPQLAAAHMASTVSRLCRNQPQRAAADAARSAATRRASNSNGGVLKKAPLV